MRAKQNLSSFFILMKVSSFFSKNHIHLSKKYVIIFTGVKCMKALLISSFRYMGNFFIPSLKLGNRKNLTCLFVGYALQDKTHINMCKDVLRNSLPINKMIDLGWRPYSQIMVGDEASTKIQKSLNMYLSKTPIIWMG